MTDVATLVRRAGIVRAIRGFFDGRGFTEVETAVRIPAPAPEEHIDCPPCGVWFLRASPELQMKKLLAAGMDRIYQIGPCFREGEKGSRHNPEFTMLEWYRRGADYRDILADTDALMAELLGRPTGARELSVRDAYLRFAGWDPWREYDQNRFDFDMATRVEPAIAAMGGGVFLVGYPAAAASLSKLSESACGPVAERWEFYWDGMELANCFTELCDGDEQRARFERSRANRRTLGEADYPLDGEFLDCLPQIGSAAGVALGIDRLVMALTGVKTISAVRSVV